MNMLRFDAIAKQFADRRVSRRQALTTGGAGLAAGVLAATGTGAASAQDATPEAVPDAEHSRAMLFVQSYQSGSITRKEGEPNRYTLTLEQGHGQTVFFSDRPDRIVGTSPTPEFLEGLGFLDDNPPNAALVVETAAGETDIAVVELFTPLYDPLTKGVTYDISVLGNWQEELEIGLTEAPTDLAALSPTFGSAQLFIDDCPNSDIVCYVQGALYPHIYGVISTNADMCWNYGLCQPCEPYGHSYPDYCAGYRYWRNECNYRFNRCDRGGGDCEVSWGWYVPERWCY